MAEIVIIGHGGYAEGVRSNLEMVIGVPESMHFLNFALGMERSELEAALSALVEGMEGREILFCVDLPGATPFQLAAIHTAQINDKTPPNFALLKCTLPSNPPPLPSPPSPPLALLSLVLALNFKGIF